MQISRHWRMNSQRYRLQGVEYTGQSKEGISSSFYSLNPKPRTQEQIDKILEEQHKPIEVLNWPISKDSTVTSVTDVSKIRDSQ